MNPDSGGTPGEREDRNHRQQGDRGLRADTARRVRPGRSSAAAAGTRRHEEQRGDDEHVVQHVEDRGAERGGRPQSEPHGGESDVADEIEREHPPQVPLANAPISPTTMVSGRQDEEHRVDAVARDRETAA